ncbi:MAG: hypothetical protein AAF206_25745 [Bacteroidota bacterium]
MEWLNDLKDKFSRRRIRNLDRTKEYPRDFVDIESAQNIGIIVNTNILLPEDLAILKKYVEGLKKRKKKLLIIELNFHKNSEASFNTTGAQTIFINPSKLNWLEYPNPAIENQIRKHEMDILIDFDSSDHRTSKYVCSIARAKTRTGMYHEDYESCYELMINQPESNGMKGMIKEFDYFLNMIDK